MSAQLDARSVLLHCLEAEKPNFCASLSKPRMRRV
jgi:hypothetical protein